MGILNGTNLVILYKKENGCFLFLFFSGDLNILRRLNQIYGDCIHDTPMFPSLTPYKEPFSTESSKDPGTTTVLVKSGETPGCESI